MVLTSWSLLARVPLHTNPFFGRAKPSPDKFWKRRSVFIQTGHFFGRGRYCYVQAVRLNLRALTYVRYIYGRGGGLGWNAGENGLNFLSFPCGWVPYASECLHTAS